MNSTPTPHAVESSDALTARADERLAEAYKQIARADEELTRLSEQLAKMERDAARPPSAGPNLASTGSGAPSAGSNPASVESGPPSVGSDPPPVESGPPSLAPQPRAPSRRPMLRVLAGLSLAAFIVGAALASQSSYGGRAKLVVARWVPQFVSTPSSPPVDPPLPAQPAPSPVQVAAAEVAPAQAPPVAPTATQNAAPTANAALPDQTELLQAIARDLANVQRNIEQLKADQQQSARESSKAIQDLKASQEEIKRALAKVSEQKTVLPPTQQPPAQPSPILRKPQRTYQPPYARAPPRIPREWLYDDW
ncbi:hypothetical protein JQ615_34775 [Bradyrhizobium jicamae]|uniref:Uncharacterized protein n=1 Tax=Bradyrhizobium jicamae TaxID=280332 RepID=A0ABS5FUM5_9BRAD|nr:hypothetical protein [Bradyrhizobium jicamae]MBR0800540.1 hypothetical protein [Bradyrhizobium jicamae]MBR0938284.1 hypothetical protein [Bradyrhizobium jicamae]